MPKRFCDGIFANLTERVASALSVLLDRILPSERHSRGDNGSMARGWESKSVEAQQADAIETQSEQKPRLTREEAAQFREKQSLLMARTSVLRQLELVSKTSRYRALLEQTLKDLDDRIKRLL